MGEMTSIRATCPRCGEVEMSADSIALSVRDDTGEGTYRFVCPSCSSTVEKRADRKVVMLLLSAGVQVAGEEERMEDVLSARPDGPPLTSDDLIDFHFMLADDDWFGKLLASAE